MESRIANMERKRKIAARRVEIARKRGLLRDPEGIESVLQATTDYTERAMMEAFIRVELEKAKGNGVKAAKEGKTKAKEGSNVSNTGKGGNHKTRGREAKRIDSREGRRRLLGNRTAQEIRGVGRRQESEAGIGAAEEGELGYAKAGVGVRGVSSRRQMVEAVGGADANGEGASRMKSIRCAQLEVRTRGS